MGVVCAAALLFAAAGCSAASLLLSWTESGGKQQVVSGSVDQTSANLQAALKNAGIIVSANQVGEEVRLHGETKSHKRFVLVLKRRQTSSGENTAISIEWEKDADEQFWQTVLEQLAASVPLGASSTSMGNPGR
jgi:hypothetical protein